MKTHLNRTKANQFLYTVVLFGLLISPISLLLAQQTTPEPRLPSPVSDLNELLKQVEALGYDDIDRDIARNVITLTLRQGWANDRNLGLVGNLDSLQRLVLIPSRNDDLSEKGISSLSRLTNLVSLRINCSFAIRTGVFREVCNLKQLRDLGLNAACPPAAEFSSITNLQNLVELRVTYCTNFGDVELNNLTNLVKLRTLVLYSHGLSKNGTNILRDMTALTNAVIRVSEP